MERQGYFVVTHDGHTGWAIWLADDRLWMFMISNLEHDIYVPDSTFSDFCDEQRYDLFTDPDLSCWVADLRFGAYHGN